jgi:EAL and modified HD-GYP domain-containing signal transduction protein
MDDYDFQPELAPVLPLVRFIKVEIGPDNLDRIEQRMPELQATGAKLLAEKVETAEQFERLKGMGFDYFQGYFFARPKLVKADRVSENAAMVMQLLARLNDPDMPMEEVVQLVSQDPGLSFKVLRYVNSAAVGLRSKIESIRRAVVLMGLKRIRAWASLFTMAGMDGQPSEILNLGLLRANLCEHLCRLCGEGDPDTAYTVGLLSVLDAIVSRPLNSLVEEMSLPESVRLAIVERKGSYGEILASALQLERGYWPGLHCPNASREQIIEAFAVSSELAFRTLELLGDA